MPSSLREPTNTLCVLSTSAGLEPADIEPGRDIVLRAHRGHGADLPEGVLLDDWLSAGDRVAVERRAVELWDSWRRRNEEALTVGGLSLAWTSEVELYVEVFLPTVRMVEGLRAAAEALGAERVKLTAAHADLAGCLSGELGLAVRVDGLSADAGSALTPSLRPPVAGVRHLTGAVRRGAGMPSRVRGTVVLQPYRHLGRVIERLGVTPDLAPVIDPANPPAAGVRPLAAMARKGGWIGHPGFRRRYRARRAVEQAVAAASPAGGAPESLEGLADALAIRLLAERSEGDLAIFWVLQDAFADRARTALLATGSSPFGRMASAAAAKAGRATVEVQHGFFGFRPDAPWPGMDCLSAGRVAVWSERDAAYFGSHTTSPVTVTGNPGAPPRPRRPRSFTGEAVVLMQPATVASLTLDARVTARHLLTSLRALALARPGTHVTVRPHPLDSEVAAYGLLASRVAGIQVSVASDGTIDDALQRADVCLGAVSTATLEAAVLGVPTCLVEVTGARLEWPFDESGEFPTARSVEDAAVLIEQLCKNGEPAGRDAALEALGVNSGAVESVVDLLRETAAGADPP